MRLAGRRVLVVGASSGIGRASGLTLAREGARVCFAARRSDRIESAAAEAGRDGVAQILDVTDEASCQRGVEAARAALGGLDAVVYCPGISTFGAIEETTSREWTNVFATNVIGLSLVLNAAIGELAANRGKVVVISSISIDDSPPRPKQATYGVSKFALERLIQAWQGEHRAVGFTSIACGDTLSEFGFGESLEKLAPIVQRWSELEYMYGRIMEPSAVAEQVVNAIAAKETLRRIAITPQYAEATANHDAMGQLAVETIRSGGQTGKG